MKVPKPRKLSSGNWFIQLRLGGESISVTEPTEKKCIRSAQLIKAEYLSGKRLSAQKQNTTLSQAIDKYISSRENVLSPSTIRGYRIIQNNRLQSIMTLGIQDITLEVAQNAVNNEALKCSAKTLCNAWRFVSSVIYSETKNKIDVRLPQIVRHTKPFLTPEQIEIFMPAIKDTPFEIPALLALCSLRQSEILGLRWCDVDLSNKVVYVRGATVPDEHNKFIRKETSKNSSSRRCVPIMSQLVDALSSVKEKDEMVVTMSASWMLKGINSICEKYHLPLVGVHGLRHSFASLAYHLGMPEKIAMEIGGWSDDQTMRKIYTHISELDRKKSVNAMQSYYDKFKNANENAN